jgi:hypothetical protein
VISPGLSSAFLLESWQFYRMANHNSSFVVNAGPMFNPFHIAPGFEAILGAAGIGSVEAFFDDALLAGLGAVRLDKPGLDTWRSRWRLRLDDPRQPGSKRVVYLKRYEHPPRAARREIRRANNGARSLAGVEWEWMQRLALDGIPSVEPIALVEEFDGPRASPGGKASWTHASRPPLQQRESLLSPCSGQRESLLSPIAGREWRSALLTAEVPGRSLEAWAKEWTRHDGAARQAPYPPAIRPLIRGVLPMLAELVGRFHGAGYVHRDLYLAHVFFDRDTQALRLIDLQRVLRPTLGRRRWIIKDLASLNYSTPPDLVSTTDRVRWLKLYLGLARLDARARRLIYRIVGKTRQIARHDARRRGRLSPG